MREERAMRKDDCLFCKIVAGEIPSTKVYEDERVLAFEDVSPMMPVHTLIVDNSGRVGRVEWGCVPCRQRGMLVGGCEGRGHRRRQTWRTSILSR